MTNSGRSDEGVSRAGCRGRTPSSPRSIWKWAIFRRHRLNLLHTRFRIAGALGSAEQSPSLVAQYRNWV